MQALFKHAKNFVDAKGTMHRPVFQGIYFDGTSAYATDSYVAIKVEHYPATQTGIFHYKTNQLIEGEYPDVNKAIPAAFKTELRLTQNLVHEWEKRLKPAVLVADKTYHMAEFRGDDSRNIMMAVSYDNTRYETILPVYGDVSSFGTVRLNCQQIANIFAFFKDCGVSIITLGLNSEHSPVIFKGDTGVIAVLCPINRTNHE
jgi:DNA polymerase III sliding clamp (beta) subunit (PCNA family)